MKEYNTKIGEGNYSITFETDDRKAYEQVQSLCRLLVDGKDGEAIPIEWLLDYFAYIEDEVFENNLKIAKNNIEQIFDEMIATWERENG